MNGSEVVEFSVQEYPVKPVAFRGRYYNPGTLVFPLTIEDLLSNQYVSKPRNRQIASIIKDMGWIEKYGTGIRRIRKMFQEMAQKNLILK